MHLFLVANIVPGVEKMNKTVPMHFLPIIHPQKNQALPQGAALHLRLHRSPGPWTPTRRAPCQALTLERVTVDSTSDWGRLVWT